MEKSAIEEFLVPLRTLSGVIRERLLVLGENLRVVWANDAFCHTFGLSSAEIKGCRIDGLDGGRWNIEALKSNLSDLVGGSENFNGLEIHQDSSPIDTGSLVVNGRRITVADGSLLFFLEIQVTKQTETQLPDTDDYRLLVETINSIIISVDERGRITFFNRFSEQLFGYSREEVLGQPFIGTIIPEKDGEGVDNTGLVEDIFNNPDHYYLQDSLAFSKNGEKKYFSWSSRIRKDQHGGKEILIDGNDITSEYEQRKRANVAYRMINNSPDIIARLDHGKRYVFVNRRFGEITGRNPEEFINKRVDELNLPAEPAEKTLSYLEDVERSGTARTFETRYDSSCYMATITPETDGNARIVYFDLFSRDISRLKEVEEELQREQKRLRHSEERAGSILENSLDAAYRRNLRSDSYDYMSPAIEQITGLHVEKFTALSMDDIWQRMHPDDIEPMREKLAALMQEDVSSGVLEYRFRTEQGNWVWLGDNFTIVRSEAGEPLFRVGIVRNVTRTKKLEEELLASRNAAHSAMRKAEERERILETILVNIPEGITILTAPDGKLQLVSAYYEKVIGITASQLFGMSTEERLGTLTQFRRYGADQPNKQDEYPIWRALKHGEVVMNEEWILTKKTGEIIVVSVIAAPVHDEHGTITHAVASWRDITDNKKMEAELRRNEYELRTLIESSPDLILRFDERLRYVFVNSTYEHLTGIDRDRFLGHTNSELGMSENKSVTWEADLRKVFQSGREQNIEFSFRGLFGKRYFWGRVIPEFDRIGRVQTVMMVARDITERKQAEEHIRYVSFHDSVTGLYNRAYFEEEIARLDSNRLLPVSFIMGDVNNLKMINDTFGHREGDLLLRTIATVLHDGCRDEDIIARWGGDEFAVILPDTNVETAQSICLRIKELAAERSDTIIRPSIALGTAAKTAADQDIHRVIMEAETHMYDNKLAESRRNQELIIASLLDRTREKSPQADQHVARALQLAQSFGKHLGLSASQMENIELMIRLHDIGKALIPAELLHKPSRLDQREWEIVRRHPEAAFRIIKTFAETARISDEILAQREHWNGSGYPRGLQGEQIPYLARVLSVLDVYDVITHERPYARTYSNDEALDILRREAGSHFDPELVEAFICTVSS